MFFFSVVLWIEPDKFLDISKQFFFVWKMYTTISFGNGRFAERKEI